MQTLSRYFSDVDNASQQCESRHPGHPLIRPAGGSELAAHNYSLGQIGGLVYTLQKWISGDEDSYCR